MPKQPNTTTQSSDLSHAYDELFGVTEAPAVPTTDTMLLVDSQTTASIANMQAEWDEDDKDDTRRKARELERQQAYNEVVANLNKPLDRADIKQRKGFGRDKDGKPKMLNYLEHFTVTRILNKIFGPGHWSITETHIQEFFDPSATDGIPRAVRVTKTLGFNNVEGFDYTQIEMTGYAVVQQPTEWVNGERVLKPYTWAAYEMALGNAERKAVKKAAAQLGDALGLSLYDDDAEVEGMDETTTSTTASSAPRTATAQQSRQASNEPTVEYGMNPAYCEDCGKEIRGYENRRTGKSYTTDDLVNISKKATGGRIYCLDCRNNNK